MGLDYAKVAVVNESLARFFFGDAQHALGHYITNGGKSEGTPDIQIVGVSRDAKHDTVRGDISRTVYVPLLQAKNAAQLPLHFYVRH